MSTPVVDEIMSESCGVLCVSLAQRGQSRFRSCVCVVMSCMYVLWGGG